MTGIEKVPFKHEIIIAGEKRLQDDKERRQQRDWDVFCPYCATEHRLVDEKELRINFEDKAAYFNCKSCKRVMGYNLKINPELLLALIQNLSPYKY